MLFFFFVCLLHHGRPLSFLLKKSRIFVVQVPKDSCMMFGAGGSQATLPLRFEKFRSNKKTESKASFAASMFRLKWDAVDSCHVQVPLTFSVGKVTMIFFPFWEDPGQAQCRSAYFLSFLTLLEAVLAWHLLRPVVFFRETKHRCDHHAGALESSTSRFLPFGATRSCRQHGSIGSRCLSLSDERWH